MPESSLAQPVFREIDGVSVATWELSPAGVSRGDIVWCHGTPWRAEYWAPVATALSAQYRVFLWDMPGYGRSLTADGALGNDLGTPPPGLELPAQTKRLCALIDQWQLERPHVVAHDIGGAVALGAHLTHGVDFSTLTLWDIVTLDPWGSPFFRLVAEHERVFAQLPPALHNALVRSYIESASPSGVPPEWLDILAEPWSTEAGRHGFYRQIASLHPRDTAPLVDRLDAVRCPVTIGWGAEDPWIPATQAHALAAAIPTAVEVHTLNRVGHLAPIEDAARVEAVVRSALDRATQR